MPMSPYYRELRERVGKELLLMPAVAAVVRDERGRLLLQRARSGHWSLPAGAIEPGEPPAQAAAREVYEETGLLVRPLRLLGVTGGASSRVTYANGDRVEYLVAVFECSPVGGELSTDNDETVPPLRSSRSVAGGVAWFPMPASPPRASATRESAPSNDVADTFSARFAGVSLVGSGHAA